MSDLPGPDAELLDNDSAADFIDVSPGTLAVWRSNGRYNLPYLKIGSKVRYRRSDLIDWMESRHSSGGQVVATNPSIKK